MAIVKTIALALIRAYQGLLSPLLGPACRYTPTCSHYAAEAIVLHGAAKGTALAVWRLLRCHPFAQGGFDPVPLPRSAGGQHTELIQVQESIRFRARFTPTAATPSRRDDLKNSPAL